MVQKCSNRSLLSTMRGQQRGVRVDFIYDTLVQINGKQHNQDENEDETYKLRDRKERIGLRSIVQADGFKPMNNDPSKNSLGHDRRRCRVHVACILEFQSPHEELRAFTTTVFASQR